MEPIRKSGYDQTERGERFFIIQDQPGNKLLSGRDCLLCYFPSPEIQCDTDAVLLKIQLPGNRSQAIVYPHRELVREQHSMAEPYVGVLIRAYTLSRAGHYRFSMICQDKFGKPIQSVHLPECSFEHDIDLWMNEWIPSGLAI